MNLLKEVVFPFLEMIYIKEILIICFIIFIIYLIYSLLSKNK